MDFKVGDRVNRNENKEVTGAVILEINGDIALIAYDEGGEGYWCLDGDGLISV